MSYCRFENTSRDLRDCVDAMEEAYTVDELDLSQSELVSMNRMRVLCQEFLDQYERLEGMMELDSN
jgi:hypothetical protein